MKSIDVAIAIIHAGERVLICQRRKDDTFGNLWEFPGGKLEPGETPTQALARELIEELGIRVRLTEALPPIEHKYPSVTVRLHPYLCTPVEGDARPLAAQRLAWVTPAALRDYPFPAANAALIESIIRRLTNVSSRDRVAGEHYP